MGACPHAHYDKVKLTFECTQDERAYIKMLAAKAHVNLSDLILSYIRKDFPKKLNRETLKAHKDAVSGRGTECKDLDDFWEQMGVNPRDFD